MNWLERRRARREVQSVKVPEGPPVPPVPDRRVYGFVSRDGLIVSASLGEAQAAAFQRKSFVVELPVVADYRDHGDIPREPGASLSLGWFNVAAGVGLLEADPPGGPVEIIGEVRDRGQIVIHYKPLERGTP